MKMTLRSSTSWDGVDEIWVERYPFLVGRHTDNDCSLPLAFVSRKHCRFMLHEKDVLIQDLESFNGTFVNGRRISEPTRLQDGDELSLGPIHFQVTLVTEDRETCKDLPTQPTKKCVD